MDSRSECRIVNQELLVKQLFLEKYPGAQDIKVEHIGSEFALDFQRYKVSGEILGGRTSAIYRFINPLEEKPENMHAQERKGYIFFERWNDIPPDELPKFEGLSFSGSNVDFI